MPQPDNWQNLLIAFFLFGVAILLGVAIISPHASHVHALSGVKSAAFWIMLVSFAVACFILWSDHHSRIHK
jgi:hypothetical protein